MRRLLLIFVFGLVFLGASAQSKPDTWSDFAKTTFEPKYDEKLKEYFFNPTFPASLKALEGKEVVLKGFFVPFAAESDDYIVLSKFPMSQCFFCGGAGPESIAEVKFLKSKGKFKVDDIISVKGKLKLNALDMDHVNFILTDAVLISN